MAKLSKISKHERLSELLTHLGNGKITLERFWAMMRQHGYTEDDICQWCSDHGGGSETASPPKP